MNHVPVLLRKILVVATALAALVVPEDCAAGAPDPVRPNLLLILADDLGFGDVGCQGATDLRTPHLDQLAAEGMRFANFYANCTVCSPTRAALMTGRYPDLVGVPGVIRTHADDSWGWLAPGAVLLPQVLKPAGYHSALVGKWHLGLESPNLPNARGFDHFHGFLGDMMDDYNTHLRHGRNYLRLDSEVVEAQGHATDVFTDWAIEYLRDRSDQSEPFFLYLAYNAPHTPIQPRPDWLARVQAREPELDPGRARLVALIEHLDDGIGRVLAALEENGQAGRTLVLFTSDNGGQLSVGANNGRWRGGKQDLYEGGLRVPMIARWPGRIAPGSESPVMALTMDLFATCAEAAGTAVPGEIEGVSLIPILLGGGSGLPSRDFVWMRREGNPRYQGRDYFALRRGDWKLVQNTPFEPWQLFNLVEDPGEERDRAAAEAGVRWDLTRILMRHIQRAGTVPWQPPAPGGTGDQE
ncbi:MAG: sulfatase-like hydrolase/transferase [Verrucomicrobiales bacterium]|nr:sulfatase-like hydrolase/transferase [Verrucomicrobiales bacterium]